MSGYDAEHSGKVALITGGARGFGKAFGKALADKGAYVALLDIDAGAAEAAAQEIRAEGGAADGFNCDISSEESFAALVATIVKQRGGIDILINNAALHSSHYNQPMSKMGIEMLRRMMDTNIMGVIVGAMAVKEAMKARKNPAIVNIASAGAYECKTAYGASKLAVMGLTMTLAHEFGADGVRVNCIAPSMVVTDTVRAEFSQEIIDRQVGRQILQKAGEEKDIVEIMLFLVSEKSRFITGETLRVSGGATLSI